MKARSVIPPGPAQPEAASAVSEFGHEQPAARRTHPIKLSLWSRILRALRARRTPKGPKL